MSICKGLFESMAPIGTVDIVPELGRLKGECRLEEGVCGDQGTAHVVVPPGVLHSLGDVAVASGDEMQAVLLLPPRDTATASRWPRMVVRWVSSSCLLASRCRVLAAWQLQERNHHGASVHIWCDVHDSRPVLIFKVHQSDMHSC